jgi:hypothetical protein
MKPQMNTDKTPIKKIFKICVSLGVLAVYSYLNAAIGSTFVARLAGI